MSALLQLAERAEAATGPDRELDCLIEHHVFAPAWGSGDERFTIMDLMSDDRVWGRELRAAWTAEEWRGIAVSQSVPAYTSSIDAAMQLYLEVPERVPSDPRKATAEALRQRAEVAHD